MSLLKVTRIRIFITICCTSIGLFVMAQDTLVLSAEVMRDKIRGGLLGQILGNLNGIPHEMKYIDLPGSVENYVPALPEGARTDDDTDFEWVYVVEMQRQNEIFLSASEIARLWRERINRRIWCSNQYARQLMDIGLEPPLTGNVLLNPWAEFNISGQFLCETFGLLGPGMPQTASRIGLNYTRVAIDGEPAQTTQLFNTMIATAFTTADVSKILDAGLRAVDQKSSLVEIINQVRSWHAAYPDDWRKTRQMVKETYSQVGGKMRDRNGYELNTAATIAALLYGDGHFAKTLQTAFNFGWDCDNTAATAGTIIGVTKGYKWMLSQGWIIVDRYKNTTRDNMPMDETITSFSDRLIDLAEKIIIKNGGKRVWNAGTIFYSIPVETPRAVVPFLDNTDLAAQMRKDLSPQILNGVMSTDAKAQARGAYLAICLDLEREIKERASDQWEDALNSLQRFDQIAQVLFHHSPVPAAKALQDKVLAAGIKPPGERKPLWE